jgi:hypothetical protein
MTTQIQKQPDSITTDLVLSFIETLQPLVGALNSTFWAWVESQKDVKFSSSNLEFVTDSDELFIEFKCVLHPAKTELLQQLIAQAFPQTHPNEALSVWGSYSLNELRSAGALLALQLRAYWDEVHVDLMSMRTPTGEVQTGDQPVDLAISVTVSSLIQNSTFDSTSAAPVATDSLVAA